MWKVVEGTRVVQHSRLCFLVSMGTLSARNWATKNFIMDSRRRAYSSIISTRNRRFWTIRRYQSNIIALSSNIIFRLQSLRTVEINVMWDLILLACPCVVSWQLFFYSALWCIIIFQLALLSITDENRCLKFQPVHLEKREMEKDRFKDVRKWDHCTLFKCSGHDRKFHWLINSPHTFGFLWFLVEALLPSAQPFVRSLDSNSLTVLDSYSIVAHFRVTWAKSGRSRFGMFWTSKRSQKLEIFAFLDNTLSWSPFLCKFCVPALILHLAASFAKFPPALDSGKIGLFRRSFYRTAL
jgi:hypothetical protein